jgi:hypothetical protein
MAPSTASTRAQHASDVLDAHNEFLRVFALETFLALDSPLLEATGTVYSHILGDSPERVALRTGNIYHLFESVMETRQDQLALATESGLHELTYGQFHKKINAVAAELLNVLPPSTDTLVRPRVLCLSKLHRPLNYLL